MDIGKVSLGLFASLIGSRIIDRHEEGELLVSTVYAGDTRRYETAVKHPEYNGGDIIIVANYSTEAEAISGHDHWLRLMTANELPQALPNNPALEEAVMHKAMSGENFYPRKPKAEATDGSDDS